MTIPLAKPDSCSFLPEFDALYAAGLGVRANGFRAVFLRLEQTFSEPYTIVETGVAHLPPPALPWTDVTPHGHSTLLFEAFIRHHGGTLISIDCDTEHCKTARTFCADSTRIICADSPTYLAQPDFVESIDCLYLDSLDIDWQNPHHSAHHHLAELLAAAGHLSPNALVCVDDSPNGFGKGGYVSGFMQTIHAERLFDAYQCGWQLRQAGNQLPSFFSDETESGITQAFNKTVCFRYIRDGYDERIVEFQPDGRITRGKDACEEHWMMVYDTAGNPSLWLAGSGCLTCELKPESNNNWRGRWVIGEKMAVSLCPIQPQHTIGIPKTFHHYQPDSIGHRVELDDYGAVTWGQDFVGQTWRVTQDAHNTPQLEFYRAGKPHACFRAGDMALTHFNGSEVFEHHQLHACEQDNPTMALLRKAITSQRLFDIITPTLTWQLEMLPGGRIGQGRTAQFHYWDVTLHQNLMVLSLSNSTDHYNFTLVDEKSLHFTDNNQCRICVPERGAGAYLLPYFSSCLSPSSIHCIVEVGCAEGVDTRALQAFFNAEVHGFECHPHYVDICNASLADRPGIYFHGVGVSDTIREESLFHAVSNGNPQASSFLKAHDDYPYERYQQQPVTVATTTLQRWADDHAIANVDLLCLDVQGTTLTVLKGMGSLLARTRYIIAELGTRAMYVDEILAQDTIQYLQEQGFQLLRSINQWGVTNSGLFYDHPHFSHQYQSLPSWFGDYLFKRVNSREREFTERVIAQKSYHYERVGYDDRQLQFLADGTIGQGAAEFEMHWYIEDADGDIELLIVGMRQITCRLRYRGDGNFIGHWLFHEGMPIHLSPTAQKSPAIDTAKE